LEEPCLAAFPQEPQEGGMETESMEKENVFMSESINVSWFNFCTQKTDNPKRRTPLGSVTLP